MRSKDRYAQRFAKSLQIVKGSNQLYACPLCLISFPVSEAQSLTWDHYPPQSIGGRDSDIALVCQTCRDKWDRFDAEINRLKKYEDFERQFPGMEPIKMQVLGVPRARGLRHRAAICIETNTIKILGRDDKNSRDGTDRLIESLNALTVGSTSGGVSFQLHSDNTLTYNREWIERSFLKAAYLAAFDGLGYPYILSSCFDSIRQQVANPELNILFGHTWTFPPSQSRAERQIILAYVYDPFPLTSLAVFFVGYELKHTFVTFLPLPSFANLLSYERLTETLRGISYIAYVKIPQSEENIYDTELVIVDEHNTPRPVYQLG